MKPIQESVIVLQLIRRMEERGSWCGETHIQKAVYFLKTLLGLPLSYEFVMYKHGPFSFDLRDDLTGMQADQLMELRPKPYPYGPSLSPTSHFETAMKKRFPKTLSSVQSRIDFVANNLSNKQVSELERLATALYVWERNPDISDEKWVERIRSLKPHISSHRSERAVEEVRELIRESEYLRAHR